MKQLTIFSDRNILILIIFSIINSYNISLTAKNLWNFDVLKTSSVTSYSGNVITTEGAWCWFADPRAMYYENASGSIKNTYIGYIDIHGNIKATQHNAITGKTHEVLIRSYFQPDDHNNPSFLILPDERVMIFYSRHTDEACFYYRISKLPGDITTLGAEKKLVTANNTTYPNPYILSDDPNHIYLAWRGINWHPTIAQLSMPDANDDVQFTKGPYQIVQSTGARPYAKYVSNGKDRIYLTYTTGHPDNEYPNYVYYNYIDINSFQLKDIKGNLLGTVGSGVHNVNKTTYPTSYPFAMVDLPTNQRDWVWQTALAKDGNPVIAMVQISNDKNTHNYYYAKWTGTEWRKTFLASGGGKFHQTAGLELCYSGGMALDEDNPDIVYCSLPVTGTSGTVFEINKFVIGETGSIISTENITSNSPLNNVRPYMITGSGKSAYRLIWMHGNYYDWIVSSTRPLGYITGVNADFSFPAESIELNSGLIVNEQFNGTVSGTAKTSEGALISTQETSATISYSSTNTFSVSISPYIFEGAYYGTIFKAGNFTYSIDKNSLKPTVSIGDEVYKSSNLLGNSDVWATQARGTSGAWYTPTKLKYFNLTLTYADNILRIYRNGLIDQTIVTDKFVPGDVIIGGFNGWVEDCLIYNRELNNAEVKKLTETSLSYTLITGLIAAIELETIYVPQNIYTDIVLPAKSASGNTISWDTDNATLVKTTGLVTLPDTETPVKLTATIGSLTKTFETTVFPRNIWNNKMLIYNFESDDIYTSGSTKFMRDKSGKNYDAAIMGNALINGTLDLSTNTAATLSSNGYALIPSGMLSNLRSYTFLAKIKPASLTSQPRIFDFGSASSNSVFLRAAAFTAGFKYNGGTTTLINSSTALTVNQEAKVAMVFDAKTKITKVYLNGTETASASTFAYEPYQLIGIGEDKRNYIGRAQWWDTSESANNVDFKGTIDDFFLFNIALTPAEINLVQSGYTGLNKTEINPVNIYPNPVEKNSLYLISGIQYSNNFEVIIRNSIGQIIEKTTTKSSLVNLNSPSENGIYFVTISSFNGLNYTTKMVVR